MPNQEDDGFADRFIFVPTERGTTITASGVLNNVTANLPFFDSNVFRAPTIESVNNGDDIFVRFVAEDNSIVMEVFANADGSKTDITVRNLTMDPADFADLITPADPEDILNLADIDLQTVFGDQGFSYLDPFASFFGNDSRSFNDGNIFGSYDFFATSRDYGSFGGGIGGAFGGGSFYEAYSTYSGIDYINLDIFG
jgi:hypothetical protein